MECESELDPESLSTSDTEPLQKEAGAYRFARLDLKYIIQYPKHHHHYAVDLKDLRNQ